MHFTKIQRYTHQIHIYYTSYTTYTYKYMACITHRAIYICTMLHIKHQTCRICTYSQIVSDDTHVRTHTTTTTIPHACTIYHANPEFPVNNPRTEDAVSLLKLQASVTLRLNSYFFLSVEVQKTDF